MSTSWSETATEICSDALMHLGVISTGESIGGDELAQALRALDSVLKELPLYGYSWPKLSSETAFTWVSGQTIALPARKATIVQLQAPTFTSLMMAERLGTPQARMLVVGPWG